MRINILSAILAAAALLCRTAAPAQFNLNTWMNFEEGQLPPTTLLLHNSNAQNTRVVEYRSLGRPEILAGPAAAECGRFGVELKTDAKSRYLCLAAPTYLQRAKLGENGRALFQADIFLDGQDNIGHTMSVVALGVDQKQLPKPRESYWKMYRLGVLGGGKAFFSFTDGSAAPKIYLHEKIADIVPAAAKGWHRIQFIIEGQRGISCYVDGVRTSYSPIEEGTHQVLQPGLLVSAPAEAPLTVYMDNLSIQWTMDPTTPMPESPWISSQAIAASAGERLLWHTNFGEAVADSRSTGKPILALFYIPGNLAFQEVSNNIFQNNEEARSYLSNVVPVKIDANQLMGANVARQYGVIRVPSFLVLDTTGKEKGRFVMAPGERWRQISPKMKEILAQ